ncbi:MAG: type II toxin-antitoxin system RelE/ParE family toxin [Methanobacterium sp.]|nr:type II toxin-antitoxin system RelE/ParE family toxin [Methanobacterium sp.]
MTYSIKLSDEAKARLKKYSKSDSGTKREIENKFRTIVEKPYHYKILSGELHDARSAPVGNYRIIYDILEDEKKVFILYFGHRDDIYDDRKLFKAFRNSPKRFSL